MNKHINQKYSGNKEMTNIMKDLLSECKLDKNEQIEELKKMTKSVQTTKSTCSQNSWLKTSQTQ